MKSNAYRAILPDDGNDVVDEKEENVDGGPLSVKRQTSTLANSIQRTVWLYTAAKELQKIVFHSSSSRSKDQTQLIYSSHIHLANLMLALQF